MFKPGVNIRCINAAKLDAFEDPPLHGEVVEVAEIDATSNMLRVKRDGMIIAGRFAAARFQAADLPVGDAPIAPPSKVKKFSGSDYSPSVDHNRLKAQIEIIRDLMLDGRPRSLFDIEHATGFPSASVSAQLRNLRKAQFGGHMLTKERDKPTGGTWIYTLKVPANAQG